MKPTNERQAVVVTGASRGIGAAMTKRLADEGYVVYATQRRPPTGPRAAAETVVPVTLDVTDDHSITAAVDTVRQHVSDGGLFALINNAGVFEAGPLEEVSMEVLDNHWRTNVTGALAVTQAFLPLLRAGGGRIVNVSSISAHLTLPCWGVYSATKAALASMSDALRMELAPWGVDVCVLTLGAFATDIRGRGHAAWVPTSDSGGAYETARQENAAVVAMLDQGAGDPEVVADAVLAVLRADSPPAEVVVGEGVSDLLALAAQPAEVRQAAIEQLIASAVSASADDSQPEETRP